MPRGKYKFAIILLMVFIPLLLTGCFDVRIHLKANVNGSGELEVMMKTTRFLMSLGETSQMFDDIKRDLEEDGFSIQEFAQDNEVGFLAHKKASSLDELAQLKLGEDMVISDQEIVTIEHGLFTNTFRVDAGLDLKEILGEEMAVMARLADIRFALTLPIQPGDHNANFISEDGKTLEWKLLPNTSNEIQVTASAPNLNLLYLLLAVVGASVAILILLRLRKKTAGGRKGDSTTAATRKKG